MLVVVLIISVAMIAAFQIGWYSKRVVTVDAAVFSEHCYDLKVDDEWRYGYTHGNLHGSILVKTPILGDNFQKLVSNEPEKTSYMLNELDRLPRIAAYEGLFYLTWIATILIVLPRIYRKINVLGKSASRRALSAGVVTGVAVLIFLFPMIIMDYGWSAFTTLGGPYAISMSGPYAHLTWYPGETISYRPLVELFTLPMMKIAAPFGGHWILLIALAIVYVWIAALLVIRLWEHIGKRSKGRSAV